MTTNEKIASDIQQLELGEAITLFDLDTTVIGGDSIYHFTPNVAVDSTSEEASSIYFNSVEYLPIDLQLEGFEVTSEGTQPRPTITVANISLTFAAAIESLDDLVGATLTRRRTFKKYLDDEPGADTDAQFPVDIYIIDRKSVHNKFIITWELASYLDLTGKKIPARQIIRDTCTHRYRVYVDGSFVYTNVTCPYTDATYFESDGTPTIDPAEDVCGRRISDCKLRFGDNEELPTRAFVGVSRAGAPWRT
jgi:lambda family phage minor tail protein L